MVSVEELEKMADIPISGIDRKEVAEFGSIRIDEGKTVEERTLSLIEQSGNPYFRRKGNHVVKISFANNGQSFQDNFVSALDGQV